MDRGAWWATVYGWQRDTTEATQQAHMHACTLNGGSDGKEPTCSAGDPASGSSSGEGTGYPLPWTEKPGGLQSPWSFKEST